jgi:hypothetical protein
LYEDAAHLPIMVQEMGGDRFPFRRLKFRERLLSPLRGFSTLLIFSQR